MVKYFQNRELAQKLGINLAKWKRWSREFLPPDPLGGLQSGYARQYNLDDAFIVYLGGFLVSGLKFSIPEAKQILTDLKEWMKSKRFCYHYHHVNGSHNSSYSRTESYRIHIAPAKTQPPETCRFDYRAKRIIDRASVEINGKSAIMEKNIEERLEMDKHSPGGNQTVGGSATVWGARELYLSDLYDHFLELLDMTWVMDPTDKKSSFYQ
jgi:hypothetical protein